MTFRVISDFNVETVAKMAWDLHKRGFEIVGVLSADIEKDVTNEKIGECAALVCRGSWLKYRKLAKELTKVHGMREIVWEGVKTLG